MKTNRYIFLLPCFLFLYSPSSAIAFGAVAVDDGQKPPVFSIVVKQDSAVKASDAALSRCTAMGGRSCRVIASFDKCAAFATSPKSYGVGTGVRHKSARNMALRSCGDDNCEVVSVACEDD